MVKRSIFAIALLVLMVSFAASQVVTPAAPRYLGKKSSAPATPCIDGNYYYNTTSHKFQYCATNAWSDYFAAFGGGSVSNPILGPAGSASAPTYSFSGDTNTGVFSDSSDVLGFTTGGVEKWVINSSGALNPILSNSYDIGGSTTIRDIGIGRKVIFSGSTSGTTSVQATAVAGSTTLTLPAATDTLVGQATTDTLTNKTISGASNTLSNIALTSLTASTSTALGVGSIELGHASDTTISRVSAGKIAVEGVNVVTTSSTDTLTNKTLTAPVISTISNTGTITLPSSTDTLVGRNTVDTLTNKTMALGSNGITGTVAQFNAAVTDGDFETVDANVILVVNTTRAISTSESKAVFFSSNSILTLPTPAAGKNWTYICTSGTCKLNLPASVNFYGATTSTQTSGASSFYTVPVGTSFRIVCLDTTNVGILHVSGTALTFTP